MESRSRAEIGKRTRRMDDLIERARVLYRGADAAHDFDHVLRVLALVRRIGPAEGADMRLLEAATLLHDIARAEEGHTGVDHAQAGAEQAREIVRSWGTASRRPRPSPRPSPPTVFAPGFPPNRWKPVSFTMPTNSMPSGRSASAGLLPSPAGRGSVYGPLCRPRRRPAGRSITPPGVRVSSSPSNSPAWPIRSTRRRPGPSPVSATPSWWTFSDGWRRKYGGKGEGFRRTSI